MNPNLFHSFELVFILTSVVLAVLSLKRVADLGIGGLAGICLVFGALFFALSRRAARKI